MIELNFICLLFVMSLFIGFMMTPSDNGRKRRRGYDVIPVATGLVTPDIAAHDADIMAMLVDAVNHFDQALLQLPWPHRAPGDDTTIADRLVAMLNKWRDDIQHCRPAQAIRLIPGMNKKNAFTRTEAAFKNGSAAMFIYVAICGNNARPNKTDDAPILDLIRNQDINIWNGLVTPLNDLMENRFNTAHKKGFVLERTEILAINYKNWIKNMDVRGSAGIWSNAKVMEIEENENHELHGNLQVCKGIYYPWFKWVNHFDKEYLARIKKGNGGILLTNAEKTAMMGEMAPANFTF